MKSNRKYRKATIYAIIGCAVIAFGYDLATSTKVEVQPNSFKYESEFNAVTAPTTPVPIAVVTSDFEGLDIQISRSIDPGYAQIEAMVRKAIELQGGLDSVVKAGDTVMLKVNLVGGNSPSGQGENTDVRVVKALIKTIYDFQNDVHIVVAEGTARTNDDFNVSGSVWHNSGYVALLSDTYLSGISYSLLNLNQGKEDMVAVNLGSEGTAEPYNYTFHVHKKEVTADVYISVPVLKIHNPGITCALKNQIGTAPGCYYGYNKGTQRDKDGSSTPARLLHALYAPQDWTEEEIVDLSRIADIDFVVVDAVMCLQTSKGYNGTNQLRMNTIIAGNDPVAVDNVCTRLLGLNPDDIDHICLAEKMGMGTNNNDYINVVGTPISKAMKRAKKSLSPSGRFGRSNRTWILSGPYVGTDISTEHIADEANYIPVAGSDGWSLPVYFFDDQIDLNSFYNGATNVVTYAFTYFDFPADTTAELWMGNHEAVRVYLNNDLVYEFTSTDNYEASEYGEKVAQINIQKGENTLMVKTLNTFSNYTFALNICEVESDVNFYGNRIKGLKFYLPAGNGEKIYRPFVTETVICEGGSYFAGGAEQTETGIYYDTVPGGAFDSVFVTILNVNPPPPVDLGEDVSVTKPESVVLDAGPGFATYLWNTDETTRTITVNSTDETASEKNYWVIVTDNIGCENSDTITVTYLNASALNNEEIPAGGFRILPNPFSLQVTVSFTLEKAEHASVRIYDIQGKLIKILTDDFLTKGTHSIKWDGSTDNNSRVQRGQYICTLQTATNIQSMKIFKD